MSFSVIVMDSFNSGWTQAIPNVRDIREYYFHSVCCLPFLFARAIGPLAECRPLFWEGIINIVQKDKAEEILVF